MDLILYSVIFIAGYPITWSAAKLITSFNKGLHNLRDNYHGISIVNAVSKIYDYDLNNRLMLWYTVCHEQAGAKGKVRYALFNETVMHSIATPLTMASSSVSSGTNWQPNFPHMAWVYQTDSQLSNFSIKPQVMVFCLQCIRAVEITASLIH